LIVLLALNYTFDSFAGLRIAILEMEGNECQIPEKNTLDSGTRRSVFNIKP